MNPEALGRGNGVLQANSKQRGGGDVQRHGWILWGYSGMRGYFFASILATAISYRTKNLPPVK